MDKAALAKLLNIEESASDEDIETAIKKLQAPPADDTELSKAEGRILALEQQLATREAESIVEQAIKNGRLLPKQKETAVKMALRNKDEFNAFIESQPDKLIEFGERGSHSSGDINYAKYEPSAVEMEVAKSLGVVTDSAWKIGFMRSKAKMEGVEIPVEYGKEAK